MKLFPQLGIQKLFLRGEPQASADELRILHLFRNRAELKKAYGELQKEVYRLKDRIKQQEGVTLRAEERLAALEGRLAFVETGYPALVFYQLRRLWTTGRELLDQLVADLARRQDQHERQQHFSAHHKQQSARLEAADREQSAADKRLAEVSARLGGLLQRRSELNRIWHYFKRRKLAQPIALAEAEQLTEQAALRAAKALVGSIQKEPVPEFPGMSLEARRAINLRAIAYAEILCVRLAGGDLVRMARDAAAYREVAEEYGSRAQCEALMAKIEEAMTLLQDRTNIIQGIRARTDRLRKLVRYRNAGDTAPTAESLVPASLEGEDADAGLPAGSPNVLAEDTWDIYKVLLR